MSIFFGIFRPQGGPVDPEAFEDMRKASEREGFDSMRVHVEDKIAVGHQMLRVSPEDDYDQQPLKSSCGRYLLVGHFRLDYRDELGDKIGLTQTELERTSDSKLVMMAYQKWGEQCVHHIEGDWAFVVFDNLMSTLTLCKDRFGNSALFYGRIKNEFIFSTDPYIFHELQLRYHFKLNENAIQRAGIEGLNSKIGDTFLDNIFSLVNNTYLVIDEILSTRKVAYDQISPRGIKFLYENDYIYQFHSLLHNAIRSRLRAAEIGLFLSAGLDSSLVSYFASNELMHKKKILSTFTSYPFETHHLSPDKRTKISERDYVEQFISGFHNIKSDFLCFPHFKHFDFINSNKPTNILCPVVTTNSFWLDGINKAASNKGIKLMLNGQMGNYVVSWNAPFSCLNNLFRLNFKSFYRTFKYLQSVKNITIGMFIKTELIRPFFYLIRNKKNRIIYSLFKIGFTPGFLKNNHQKLELDFSIDYHSQFSPLVAPKKLRSLLFNSNICTVGQKWYVNSLNYQLHSADPYTDNRVLSYSFSIPESLFNMYGDKKYIYKKIMEDVISTKVLSAVSGIPQSHDIGRRLQTDDNFKNLIKVISAQESLSNLFDLNYVRNLLNELESRDSYILLNSSASELLKFISLYLFTTKFARE